MSRGNPFGAVAAAALLPPGEQEAACYKALAPAEAVSRLWDDWDVVGSAFRRIKAGPVWIAWGIFLLRHPNGCWASTAVELGPDSSGKAEADGRWDGPRAAPRDSDEWWGWPVWDGTLRHHRVAEAVKGSLATAEGGLAGFVEEAAYHLRDCEPFDDRFPKLQATILIVTALDDTADPDVAWVKTLLGLGGFDNALALACEPVPV